MYRKGVSALIINKNDEFLLVNLKSFEERFFAVPGGGVEKGETVESAVYREISEELGIEPGSLQLVGKSHNSLKFKFKVIKMTRDSNNYEGSERYFFGFRFIGDEKIITPNPEEVRSYKWVTRSELKKHLLFDGQLEGTLKKIEEIFTGF